MHSVFVLYQTPYIVQFISPSREGWVSVSWLQRHALFSLSVPLMNSVTECWLMKNWAIIITHELCTLDIFLHELDVCILQFEHCIHLPKIIQHFLGDSAMFLYLNCMNWVGIVCAFVSNSAIQQLLEHPECLQLVNDGTSDGQTPMHIAAVNGYREVAQVLVEKVFVISRCVFLSGGRRLFISPHMKCTCLHHIQYHVIS